MDGGLYVSRSMRWDASVVGDERRLLLDRLFDLARVEAPANLDVKRLRGRPDLWRLRSGQVRAIFQRLGRAVVLHRVDRRNSAYDERDLRAIRLVATADGLRPMAPPPVPATEAPSQGAAEPPARPPVRARADAPLPANPLEPFTDKELARLGLAPDVVEAARRLPPVRRPEEHEALARADDEARARLATVWGRPGHWLERLSDPGFSTDEVLAPPADDAALLPLEDAVRVESVEAFDAVLELPIEDWMLYLHPSQRAPVDWSIEGPARIRGGAGTGKTVVALHRARELARQGRGTVLLTTFVATLPKVWSGLFEVFGPDVGGQLAMRTLDQEALEVFRQAGGTHEPADDDWLLGLVSDVHAGRSERYGGLSAHGLFEELEYVLEGRAVEDLDAYLRVPRTGRGTPLGRAAREAVWEAFGEYVTRQEAAGRMGFGAIRRRALEALEDGEVRRRYAAVVVDEAQDLTEVGVRLLVALSGGERRPNITLVGDGQQSIYPGGFSLRSVGLDVRGRAAVLQLNWRSSWPIWAAAQVLIGDEPFDDLGEDDTERRAPGESPLPIRDGPAPRLHVFPGSQREAADWLAELVAEDVARGMDAGDAAVLAPGRSQLSDVESALHARGVAVEPLRRYEGRHGSRIWLGTFHRAKGLEFKRVYAFGLEDGRWPPLVPGLDEQAQRDLRARWLRAAFVALTRARDELDVVVPGRPAAELAAASWAFDRT